MAESVKSIPEEEGQLVEFKDFSGGISFKELSITLSAFANTEGGTLYVGVTDRRLIQGLKLNSSLLDQIQNAAREGCHPPVLITLKKIPLKNKKVVLVITVKKSGHLHSTVSGSTYIRVGSQDKRILGDELLRLAESKSQVSFEETLLNAGLEVLDSSSVAEYYEARRATSSLRGNLGLEEFLIKVGLAKKEKDRFRIRAGAFILFGQEDESLLLQRDFTLVRYEVEGQMYSYREDLSLSVTRLMDRLMELIRPFNRLTRGVRGLKRQEKEFYPEAAIREALLNAFAHRDYRLAGLKNEVRLYPDRLEIISAGNLPNMVTLENMEERHYSRNPKIMHALLTLGLTEELGQGIHLMKQALKANDNPPPKFLENSEQLKVIFYRKRKAISEEETKKHIMDFLKVNSAISRQQIESLLSLKATRAKYLIRRLLKEGILKSVGKGPATRYVKGKSS